MTSLIWPRYGSECLPPGVYGWYDPEWDGMRALDDDLYHGMSAAHSSLLCDEWANRSAKHMLSYLNREPKGTTPAMRTGSYLHEMLSNPWMIAPVIVPYGIGKKTNPDKEFRKELEAEAETKGLPLAEFAEWDAADQMNDAIMGHDLAGSLIAGGMGELTLCWNPARPYGGPRSVNDGRDGTPVKSLCTGRVDFYHPHHEEFGCPVKVEVKSARDGTSWAFEKVIANMGYHVQDAHYRCGLESAPIDSEDWPERFRNPLCEWSRDGYPLPTEGLRSFFVVVENEAPYAVTVYEVTEEMHRVGLAIRNKRLAKYAECLHTGFWREKRPTLPVPVCLPKWATEPYMNEQEDYANVI